MSLATNRFLELRQGDVMENTMQIVLGTILVYLVWERSRPPHIFVESNLPCVNDTILEMIPHNNLLHYVMIAKDAYLRLHERCRPPHRGKV